MQYNQSWMGSGIVGGLEAGAISVMVALAMFLLLHWLGRRHDWCAARKIGWSFLLASVLTVSGDLWSLIYLNYANLQSPPLLKAVLAGIHDPGHVGLRLLCELLGVSLGICLGWALGGGHRAARQEPRDS